MVKNIPAKWTYSEVYQNEGDPLPCLEEWVCFWNLNGCKHFSEVEGSIFSLRLVVSKEHPKRYWTITCTVDIQNDEEEYVDSHILFESAVTYLDVDKARSDAREMFTDWFLNSFCGNITEGDFWFCSEVDE